MADKKKLYTVKNDALGARGVGAILVEPGDTIEVEMTDDEALLLSEFDDVSVTEGKGKRAKAADPAPEADAE